MVSPAVRRGTQERTLHFKEYERSRRAHWESTNQRFAAGRGWGRRYHSRLAEVYRLLTQPGSRVLEIGCGEGDLIAGVHPGFGVGVDFSLVAVRSARQCHPGLWFVCADAHHLPLAGQFDIVILSDILNDVWDVQGVFEQVTHACHQRTRVLVNCYSRLWEPLLAMAARFGLAKPNLTQNWLTVEDLRNLLYLAGLEVVRSWNEVLFPLPVPILEPILNRFVAKVWPFRHLALTNLLVARLAPEPRSARQAPKVTVVVPARNEEGNIADIFARIPEMGRGTELIFVEGHSRDNTRATIEKTIADNPGRESRLIDQASQGKGGAVREGFSEATGDILMILDADLTVPPEDLPKFYDALVSGRGELANGVRLVYPLPGQAMRFLNLIANKAFGLAFSWLLGQPVKDTLCGTKALWKADYEAIAAQRAFFSGVDPFGDFDLLLGAARMNLRIVDVPVRYGRRSYGTSNIQRWRHGWLLMRLAVMAAKRLKFA